MVNLPGVGVFPARFVYAESISSFPNFRSNFTAVVENPKRPSRSNSDTNTRFVASRDTASILDTALPSGKEPFIDAAVSASAMMRGMGFDFCSHSEHIATMVVPKNELPSNRLDHTIETVSYAYLMSIEQ